MVKYCPECKQEIVNSYGGFCSSKCYNRTYYRATYKKDNCKVCGKEYTGKSNSKFCSIECRAKGIWIARKRQERRPNIDKVNIKCIECNIDFMGNKKRKYCSVICRNKADNRKKNSYKGKKFPCEFCGFSDLRAIHSHHVNRSEGFKRMFLCANHHYIFHSIIGHGIKSENKSPEEVLEVLRSSIIPKVNFPPQ